MKVTSLNVLDFKVRVEVLGSGNVLLCNLRICGSVVTCLSEVYMKMRRSELSCNHVGGSRRAKHAMLRGLLTVAARMIPERLYPKP